MSVTVADLLRLPSLRAARVVAGAGGLSRSVSSISVLESTDPSLLTDKIFQNDAFYGSEIVITGFTNIRDNVELQCANLRRLAEGGEVGLILFYVGALLPQIDSRLVQLADQLDFTLISMPEGRLDLRYSEVIYEVMDAILRDRMTEASFAGELLERMARLPRQQRTVDTMLKMLSDRLRASVVLTDRRFRILGEAAWPRNLGGTFAASIGAMGQVLSTGATTRLESAPPRSAGRYPVEVDGKARMELFLFKEGQPLNDAAGREAAEAVQLAASIWSRRHDEVIVTELVRAILQDEPMKMRRLANIFHIDVKSIDTTWIVSAPERSDHWIGAALIEALRQRLAPECHALLLDRYEGQLVIFMDGPNTLSAEAALVAQVLECLDDHGIQGLLTCCGRQRETVEVRADFLAIRRHLEDARSIFPLQRVFHLTEIHFAGRCRAHFHQGEQAVAEAWSPLGPLSGPEDKELLQTLLVFLLDGQSSITRTSELLFLHKNTVKYRIGRISDLLGFRLGKMPETMALYHAAAVFRLMV